MWFSYGGGGKVALLFKSALLLGRGRWKAVEAALQHEWVGKTVIFITRKAKENQS